jgi:hypothetical protein
MPENTGVLLAAQLHLLWMSQRGWNEEYVKRVRRYLATLDRLIPATIESRRCTSSCATP